MVDEDKIFEFMTKIYSEMQVGFKELKTEMGDLKTDVDELKISVQKIGAKIDGEIIPNQQALFDGYKQNTEMLLRAEQNIDILKDNVTDVDFAISEMKEDINFIASKTIRNDSKIEKINRDLKTFRG